LFERNWNEKNDSEKCFGFLKVSGAKQKNQGLQNAKNIRVLVKILKFQRVHLHPLTYTQHRP
jgi:hypothetical protein